ncbi:uncharacterized protein LOC109599050 isoform X2 [Aethina tumida]|uniref:uncharacterized protein LOC109599050 isoform X2 n=1 Tax=Aethina tumida TaxID=116153 RepID=UPI00096B51AB|nr:uncharacterized protein LOC109599050 isoform X2 [Aethina tumida]
MKKFCNKIQQREWRITVPNINFRRSLSSEKSPSKRSSGSYDLQEAQLEFDQNRSLPNSVYIDSDSESDDERFEDARTMSANSNKDDNELYADVVVCNKFESKNLELANGRFQYDVPRISFKFFERKTDDTYENAEVIVEEEQEPEQALDYDVVKPLSKSELKIHLTHAVELDDSEDERKEDTPEKYVSQTEITFRKKDTQGEEKEDTQGEEKEEGQELEGSLSPIIKSGSDPNIIMRDHEEEDGFYKVPRSFKQSNRLSQSLHDFNQDEIEVQPITTAHSSIEHISCSQIIVQGPDLPTKENSNSQTSELDYCKVRKKMPMILRRPTMLKKPKNMMNSWNNFKTKFNNLLEEQAAHQRVGAFNDREKPVINLEEVLKTSKDKCKKVFTTTGRIFKHKRPQEIDGNSSSSLNKNEVFFDKVHKVKASDIVYKFDNSETSFSEGVNGKSKNNHDDKRDELDFSTVKSTFKKNKYVPEGQNGFEDLRRYVKQGGDFCKELATILQERSEAETTYAKSLQKLSHKLSRACRDGVGGLNEAWKSVALELEARAESHRVLGAALLEEAARPLRTLSESQHRARKQSESAVEKSGRLLADWRAAEAKGKKQSHSCARDNEKLQDAALVDSSRLSRSTSLIQLAQMHNKNSTDKENAKLQGKKRKAEDAVKKADIEYYTLCVRAERARLEWESAVSRGINSFQSLEEERLNNQKSVLTSYLHHTAELTPKLLEATERLKSPVTFADPSKDMNTFMNLRQTSQQVSEQLLPDFYCEHITLAMNKERRKQALIKLLHLIRQDIERERKSKNGLENLSKAIKQTPNFGAEDSQQSVTEKLYHMKSMLTYLEGARYKVQSALAELDSRRRGEHPLAAHITVTRDKSGLQQSILKVPQWLREEYFESDKSPVSEKSAKSGQSDNSDPHINDVDDPEWPDRGAADGNSNQPDSDFDEFSSHCSSTVDEKVPNDENLTPIAKCKALYPYKPNLTDELTLTPGDVLAVYRQQDDGWWLGECNGSVGIFPATYVEIIPNS